jgi:hypothetical protein
MPRAAETGDSDRGGGDEMIRAMTPQERWELSRHTDWDALRDGLLAAKAPLDDWLRDGLTAAIERSQREVVWVVPISDRRPL